MTFDITDMTGLLFATTHLQNLGIFLFNSDFQAVLELRNVGQSQMSGHHSKARDLLVQMRCQERELVEIW